MNAKDKLKEKLLSRIEIDENECWLWQGTLTGGGYGYIRHEGKMTPAHRVFFEVFSGEIPAGLVLDHLCREKQCCRPSHLEPVKQAENIRRGMSTNLTWDKVREIRRLYAKGGTSYAELARKFRVSKTQIGQVVRNERWIEEVAA